MQKMARASNGTEATMKQSAHLKHKQQEALSKAKAFFSKATAEKRDLTDDERAQVDALQAEADGYTADITRWETFEANEQAEADAALAHDQEQERLAGKKPRTSGLHNLAEDKPWNGPGEFLQAVALAAHDNPGRRIDPRLLPEAAASGMGEGSGADGGFNVGTEIRTDLMEAAQQESVIYPYTSKIEVGDGFNGVELPYFDDSDRSGNVVMGGLRAFRAAEAAQVTAVKPSQETLSIKLQKLMALIYATSELLQDWRALQSFLMPGIGTAFGFALDTEYLTGSGAGQMAGALRSATNPALITVNKESGQAASTVVALNVIKMRARMPALMRSRGIWLVNPTVEPQLHQMSIVVGVGGIAVYMPANGLAGDPFDRLYGRPVIPTEHAKALGTLGDINFMDFGSYITVQKGGVVAAESMHLRFIYDEMTFRFTWRINGKPRFRKAFTPKNGDTLSPFVTLEAR
jgi:HK97 family phage major capsid protein